MAAARIRLGAWRSLVLGQRLPVSGHVNHIQRTTGAATNQQWREMHLYLTAKAKTTLGMHKVMAFERYDGPARSESSHRVDLVESRKGQEPRPVATGLTLEELYEQVGPGKMLYMTLPIVKAVAERIEKMKADETHNMANKFAIVKAYSQPVHIKKATEKKHKYMQLRLSATPAYFSLVMDRAYQAVEAGAPVEFSIRLKGSHGAAKNINRMKDGGEEDWKYILDHYPHLRPDFIIKGMPEETQMLISPVTDGTVIKFVVGMRGGNSPKGKPITNLEKRLQRVKAAVKKGGQVKTGKGQKIGTRADIEAEEP